MTTVKKKPQAVKKGGLARRKPPEGPQKVVACGLTDRGQAWNENQDTFHVDVGKGLFMVCDGMGGVQGGAVAAQAAVAILPGMIEQRLAQLKRRTGTVVSEALKESIAELSATLRERTRDEPQLRGMGTTVVLALVQGKQVYIAHVGDSRAYLLRKGVLEQLTRDHSVVAVMLELGQITPKEARVHPLRSRITRCIGMEGKAVADIQRISVARGCRLLLCSDGLTGMVPDAQIAQIMKKARGPKTACRVLVDLANKAGGLDNITTVVVDLGV